MAQLSLVDRKRNLSNTPSFIDGSFCVLSVPGLPFGRPVHFVMYPDAKSTLSLY